MQGIYISGKRPKSKKEVKEMVAFDSTCVRLEATSMFGNEYEGPVSEAPNGRYNFVGPDPYTSRKFYGEITVINGKITVK